MDDYKLYILLAFIMGLISVGFGIFNLFINKDNYEKIAKFTRERYIASFIWAGCLAWCVPHTEVIIFKFIAPYLWYLAIAVVILSFLYLDYLFARALAGALIIGAYVMVNFSFTFHTQIPIIISICSWLVGIMGIIVSGRPSLLRDLIRLNANKRCYKIATSSLLFLIGAVMLLNGTLELLK